VVVGWQSWGRLLLLLLLLAEHAFSLLCKVLVKAAALAGVELRVKVVPFLQARERTP
jgi:hypothetical protein